MSEFSDNLPPQKNMGAVPLCNNRFVRARTVWFSGNRFHLPRGHQKSFI
jgi:hypothetical protein